MKESFCSNCGAKLNENDLFCANCGTKKEAINNNNNESYSLDINTPEQNNMYNNQTNNYINNQNSAVNSQQNTNSNKFYTKTNIPIWVIIVPCLIGIILLYTIISSIINTKPNKYLLGTWISKTISYESYDSDNVWYFDDNYIYNYLNISKTDYVYGSYKAKTGYEGLKMAGFQDSYERLKATGLNDKNIVTIEILPQKMILDGKDQSISGTRYYIWIITNGGQNAEVFACSTGSTYYFIKSK